MKKILSILCTAFLLGACSDFLEEYSQDLAKVESYTDLDETLLGDGYLPVGRMYIQSSTRYLENDYFQVTHYMSDELSKYIPSDYGDHSNLQNNMFGWHTWQQEVGLSQDGSSRAKEDKDWNQAYHSINICNMVLDAIDEQKAENDKQELEKSRIKGEAAFLRALYYFQLVNLYGKPYCQANLSSPAVPIKLTPVVEDKMYTTNTVSEVYKQILNDLNLADTCLVNNVVKNHPYRADITSVYLLKSRVYLYMQDWEEALKYAQKTLAKNGNLLNLNSFSSAKGEVLSKSSPETIFSTGGHVLANMIYNERKFSYGDWLAVPTYIISDDLAAAFNEGENDLRTQYYIRKDTVGYEYYDVPYSEKWIFCKILGWELGYKSVSDNFLFRTAEAYLNGAEAAALAGDEGTARTLLKTLRDNRMRVSRAITESGQALVNLIREERQRELCLEGHRWFDLRRYMVREQYPYTKKIVHYFTQYTKNLAEYSWSYVLEENDPAYTLALPYEVLNFQNTLGSNSRPARTSSIYIPEEEEEVAPPEEPKSEEYWIAYNKGYEDGYAAGLKDAANGNSDAYWDENYNPYDYYDEADEYDGYQDGFDAAYDKAMEESL